MIALRVMLYLECYVYCITVENVSRTIGEHFYCSEQLTADDLDHRELVAGAYNIEQSSGND